MNGQGQLYVMVGPPFSGKTHWIEQGGFEGVYPEKRAPAVVCPDKVRRSLTGRYTVMNATAAEEMVWSNISLMIRALLANGNNVILDTSNVRRHQRAKWKDFDPVFILLDTPLKVALERATEAQRGDAERVIRRGFDSMDPVHISEGIMYRVEYTTEQSATA